MQFTKMHGFGNDFVIISHAQIATNIDIPALALKISNRYTGIGCDQFIIYKELDLNHYQMWVYNQDGSLASACGNATRCLTKLAYMKYGINDIEIDVFGRKLQCNVVSPEKFEVNMGTVSFDKPWMHDSEKIWAITKLYSLNPKDIICADVGNPHLIILTDHEMPDADKYLLGSLFEKHKLFPDGVNVNFAYIKDKNIILKVWERGAGFTLACGSGACASFAAAHKLGFVPSKSLVHFSLGSLEMSLKDDQVYMAGPAILVAKGDYYGY